MSGLPNGWVETTLADVTAPRGEKADPKTLGDTKFIGMDHIEAQTAKLLGSRPASELKSSVAVFKKGDLLYGRLRPYLNKVHLAEFDGVASAEFIIFPPSNAIESRFLQGLLRSPDYRELADQRSTGDRPRVKFNDVCDFTFPLPPLPEQRRIVKKLDTLSAHTTTARMHLTAIAKLVERYKLAVLEKAFFSKSNANCQYVSFLKAAESTQNGLSKRKGYEGELIKVLRLSDLQGNEFKGDDPRKIRLTYKEVDKFSLHQGDLLIVRVNGSENIVGRMLVWGEDEEWAFCDHFIRAKTKDDFDPHFVRWMFETDKVRVQIESSFVSSAGQKTINKTILSEVNVPKLPIEQQREIVDQIETAFSKVDRLISEAEKALRLTDSLDQCILASAFAGELISQDLNDEPASALLARTQESHAKAVKKSRKKLRNAKPMQVAPQERVLIDSADWPETGLSFEDITKRITLPYEDLKDTVFALLEGDKPKLRQEFDSGSKVMKIKRVAS